MMAETKRGTVAVDALELQIVSALQRFASLQRRVASDPSDPTKLLDRAISELGTALEELRVAQEQIVEHRVRTEELQVELSNQYRKYWLLFDRMPQPYLVTKPDSAIVEANRAAAELLNVSQRFLTGKILSVFVCEDRRAFLTEVLRVAPDTTSEITFRMRPRERAPLTVVAHVSADEEALRWVLRVVAKTPDETSTPAV
jgi:PAS domain-containing protein